MVSHGFCFKDVCRALHSKPSRCCSIKSLDDDERAKFNRPSGGEQESNIINESGLYTLILRCRDAVTPGTIPTAFVNGLQVRFFLRSAAPEVTLKLAPAGRTHKDGCRPGSQRHSISSDAGNEDREQNLQRPLKPGYRSLIHFAVWCSRPDGELTADESAEPVTGRRARRIGRGGGADHHVLLHRRCEQMPA